MAVSRMRKIQILAHKRARDEIVSALNKARVEFTLSVPFERFVELKEWIERRRRWWDRRQRWRYTARDPGSIRRW